jgi:TDG/mug DNA glycosylase family protein
LVPDATASAKELTAAQYARGALALARKLSRFRPRVVAFLGIDAYRIATGERLARVGEQPKAFAETKTWLLPNPSGLNAHYQVDDLARVYRRLKRALERR